MRRYQKSCYAMPQSADSSFIIRLQAIIAALRAGPLVRPVLLAQLARFYPEGDSARRMLDRDLRQLAQLGITIERSVTRPPVYETAEKVSLQTSQRMISARTQPHEITVTAHDSGLRGRLGGVLIRYRVLRGAGGPVWGGREPTTAPCV